MARLLVALPQTDRVHPSTALAAVLVDELILGGVTDVVLCPGSRNAPLSMALHAADAAQRLRLHVRIDERTAGFLALGLGRGSGRPAAVVTTSGTAVANLHPAVLEAHHGGVPLLVLSADRPPELRDVGANQTIDQRIVFGPALRFFHEYGVPADRPGQQAGWRAVLSRALGLARGAGTGLPGPVQLNVPLVEPLLPAPEDNDGTAGAGGWPEALIGRDGPWTVVASGSGPVLGAGPDGWIRAPEPGERVLFVADLTHPLAGPLARQGHSVISEAGGAAGAAVLSAGLHLLADPEFIATARPDRVIVLGRPTMYRQIAALLADDRVRVEVVAPVAGYADPSGRVGQVSPSLAWVGEMSPQTGDVRFHQHWQRADAAAAAAVAGVVAELDLGSGPRLAADLVAALPAGATLVLGSSQPPRDVGLAAAARDGLRLLANRGVAGIDGMISTATGIALAGPGPTVALLGDLTFLHDCTGLIIGPHEPRPDLVLVVANNDGGGIFQTLEPGRPQYASAFERVFGTPHGVQLAGLVEACGAAHRLISGADELTELLADLTDTSEAATGSGISVVEVAVSRTELVEQHRRISAAVRAATRGHAADDE